MRNWISSVAGKPIWGNNLVVFFKIKNFYSVILQNPFIKIYLKEVKTCMQRVFNKNLLSNCIHNSPSVSITLMTIIR